MAFIEVWNHGNAITCCSHFSLIKWYKRSEFYSCVICKGNTVKLLLFVITNFHDFCKRHWSIGSWIRGFKQYRQQLTGTLYFVGFLLLWFKWTTKSAKIRTPRLIMISQYYVCCLQVMSIQTRTYKQIYKQIYRHIWAKQKQKTNFSHPNL
jgi:hypothetical protein